MKKSVKISLIIFLILLTGGLGFYSLYLGLPLNTRAPELEFPIREVDNITGLSSFGIPDWSGPGTIHNGIDLEINDSVTLISPVKGTVISISEQENVHSDINNVLFSVKIMVNLGWIVDFVIEPMFPGSDVENNTLQREAISVSLFQKVDVGDEIGTLLYNEGEYSHLHYMINNGFDVVCPYDYSSPEAQELFDLLAERGGEPPCV